MKSKSPLAEEIRDQLFSAIISKMEKENISQAEVARLLGVERTNINRLMRGKIPVTIDFLLRIAENIDLSVGLRVGK